MHLSLLWFLIIGLLAGWAASKVMKGRSQGLVINLVVGVVGAVIGGWLFSELHVMTNGLLGALVVSFIGAVILLALIGLVKKG
jgi:uncharacterized membrane protein YeaQ/YmgE (transglycosylase-associated protein family)